ncbi:uncharacterized protein LOC118669310 [Myotis myotis]|uniref:uncharacterized protein LOC118669310 n=1 Tax=Myotis myotis TaxID=51298 RepID=UPI00174CEF50|nr:uncharacterized protein LOC118669310 [Myotis myotis]
MWVCAVSIAASVTVAETWTGPAPVDRRTSREDVSWLSLQTLRVHSGSRGVMQAPVSVVRGCSHPAPIALARLCPGPTSSAVHVSQRKASKQRPPGFLVPPSRPSTQPGIAGPAATAPPNSSWKSENIAGRPLGRWRRGTERPLTVSLRPELRRELQGRGCADAAPGLSQAQAPRSPKWLFAVFTPRLLHSRKTKQNHLPDVAPGTTGTRCRVS